MLAQAGSLLAGMLCRADAKALPFRDAIFDAAYASWVMNHLADRKALLAKSQGSWGPEGVWWLWIGR